MQNVIRLAEIQDIPTPPHDTYPPALVEEARRVLVARGLRYDNRTGTVYDNRTGWIERPSNPSEHEPKQSAAEIMGDVFSRWIGNAASRLSRDLNA